ncbi:hypothetical protein ACUNV4_04990 [Granulosicoccus sp. 3-233]|uniref:hypothetical protein n=1 Tax=Granulosicoccus sp. 3-233 TaxID=3417969 RepID=UPI003D348876
MLIDSKACFPEQVDDSVFKRLGCYPRFLDHPPPMDTSVFDLYRVAGGKIAEH